MVKLRSWANRAGGKQGKAPLLSMEETHEAIRGASPDFTASPRQHTHALYELHSN